MSMRELAAEIGGDASLSAQWYEFLSRFKSLTEDEAEQLYETIMFPSPGAVHGGSRESDSQIPRSTQTAPAGGKDPEPNGRDVRCPSARW